MTIKRFCDQCEKEARGGYFNIYEWRWDGKKHCCEGMEDIDFCSLECIGQWIAGHKQGGDDDNDLCQKM